jgi:hypothetical protein
MPSIIVSLLERRAGAHWVKRLASIHVAQAGDRSWDRDPQEAEADFLDRVRSEAAKAGPQDCSDSWLD